MRNLLKMFFLSFLSIYIISCQNKLQVTDIIQPIKLVSGKTDSVFVNDLFFAQDYNLNFHPNQKLKFTQNKEKLFLTADSSFEGLTLLEFEADMNVYQIPVISNKQKYYEFTYKPDKEFKQLNLFGSFNGWNRTDLPMTDKNGDGIFEAKVALDPGVYQYKFFEDGEEIVDPINSEKVSNGMGSFNSVRTIDDLDTGKFYLHIKDFFEENDRINYAFFIEDEAGNEITKQNVYALLNNSKISPEKITLHDNAINVNLNKNELQGNNTLRVAISISGKVSNIQTVQLFEGQPANNETFNWNDGIIYSLMIDRFYDGDTNNDIPVAHDSLSPKANYMGGDLQGVLDKLREGYFDSLGINIIWISPVYDNPNEAYKEYPAPHRYYSGYHGYWPISSKTVDEHFGDINNVKKIVESAHKKGIKVLLDFVSNHVHIEHPYYKEHRDWFGKLELPDGRLNLRFWDEYRLTTWFEPYLPSFDYLGSKEALEEMTNVAVWWLKETGADGFRHDAVKHVPNEFWRRLNEKMNKEVSSEREIPVYQIGETFGSYDLISSYVNNGQLNAQFNFNLYDVALPTFIRKESSFSGLDKEMHKTFSVYGINHLMGNIMDSHDKNRFMAFADGDLDAGEWSAIEVGWNNPPNVDDPKNYKKLILYIAYMNTIPGLPVIYYGSEFGMSGASDPDNRRMMRFGSQLSKYERETLNEVRKIINIRKNHSALRHGDFYTIRADENIYAYIRSDMNERILTVLNKSNTIQKINIKLPASYNLIVLKDLATEQTVDVNEDQAILQIPSMEWKTFKLE